MEKKQTNFSTLKKWVKKSRVEEFEHEAEIQKIFDAPIKVTKVETLLVYGLSLMVFGFIVVLLLY